MTLPRLLRLPSRSLTPRLASQCGHIRQRYYTRRPGDENAGTPAAIGKDYSTDRPVVLSADSAAATPEHLLARRSFPRLVHRSSPMSIPKFRTAYKDVSKEAPSAEEVTLYGRIVSIRRHGAKLIFVTIVNEFERVQGMISWKKVDDHPDMPLRKFKDFSRLVERGDHISLTGRPTRTDSGELTLEATRLPELLAPTSEPIPEDLKDAETRIQHRHVDMLVNRVTADVLRLRAYIMKYMRDYFHGEDFLELQTPILGENAGGAIAKPFTTTATEFSQKELALRIAPELWLKRLVIGGVDKVFEIGPAFRNEGIDATHNPEFTMCEFYSAYATLPDIIARTEELLAGMAAHCQELISTKLSSLPQIDVEKFTRPFRQVQFIPGIEEAIGSRLPDLTGENAYHELLSMLALAKIDLHGAAPATLSKLLDRLAAIYLEPESSSRPLFITHHPVCMSPLAKSFTCPKTGQLVAARAELFVDGHELANMYEEENDPVAQAQKLAEHHQTSSSALVKGGDTDAAPLDRSYIRAMEAGLPPTGGWGCGVERLVMLFSGRGRISDCLSFGSLRNVVGLTSALKGAGDNAISPNQKDDGYDATAQGSRGREEAATVS